MKYIFLFALGITIVALVLTFVLTPLVAPPSKPSDSLRCEKDSDCFPGECCHPESCLNSLGRPDCEDVACTLDCQPGTMDCGCGSCACIDGKCTVKFVESDFCSGAV